MSNILQFTGGMEYELTEYGIEIGIDPMFNNDFRECYSINLTVLQLLEMIKVTETRYEFSTLEVRNAELLEAVKKAHEILLHEMDNGRTPSMLQGVGLGYFEDVICGVNHD